MEIPYIVHPRKDTGLTNSKVAIWLFLASEVMLFGGLFSAYIMLRIGADFPWPSRVLPILPGLINTAILIASSVTVVFAWAELKLRNWKMFQVYMSITLLCAVAFMVIKIPFEYASKFAHQAIRMDDFSVLEGHVRKEKVKGDKVLHEGSKGNYLRLASTEIKAFEIRDTDGKVVLDFEGKPSFEIIEGFTLKVDITRFYEPYFATIFKQMQDSGMKAHLYLGKDKQAYLQLGEEKFVNNSEISTESMLELLENFQDYYLNARSNNHELNAMYLRKAWSIFREEREEGKHISFVGKRDDLCLDPVAKIHSYLQASNKEKYLNTPESFSGSNQDQRVVLPDTVSFIIKGRGYLKFVPAKGTFGGGTTLVSDPGGSSKILHRDKTEVIGSKATSGIELAVDHIDVSHFVMRWDLDDRSGKKPLSAFIGSVDDNGVYTPPTETLKIFNSELLKTDYLNPEVVKHEGLAENTRIPKIWETHMKWAHWRAKELRGKGYEITKDEKYVAPWSQIVGYQKVGYKMDTEEDYREFVRSVPQWYSSFTGANHYDPEHLKSFPIVFVPREVIKLEASLTPKWSNYYAIYFTITGLHGLHVIGGAIVLGYYLFFGRKMFETNPEWLTNRVEVGGLFWHFVDLVWIFAFPIFYLM
jgi:heme/copper-type cytochrome/quinol oxidase subunit 3